ncbi:hypothetical protein [Nocardia sp. Marseille-Q1738]
MTGPHGWVGLRHAELRLPGTRVFFDIFNARTEPSDATMVAAVGLLGV